MSLTQVYVFDLDGVLYRGEEAVVHAPEAIARLRQQDGVRLYFLTNNSSQTRQTYADKLTRLGMPCVPEEIVTSASATAAYLDKHYGASGSRALVMGGPGIIAELRAFGMEVAHVADPTDDPHFAHETFDFVVVGMDRTMTYNTLWRAQQAILRGATFIATNRDGQYPIEEGKVTPGGGSLVAALEACTDVVPTTVGKPETPGLQTILDTAGIRHDQAVMVGDRLDTDVLCGNRLGVPTVLVLTGVTPIERAEALIIAHPEMRPGRIIPDLREL